MASNHTEKYQLSQWEAGDKVERLDFNADNAKIDAALHGLAGQVVGKAESSVVNALSSRVNAKADQSALTAAVGRVAALETGKADQSALTALGGSMLRAVVGTYSGTGLCGVSAPNSLDFGDSLGRCPLLIIIKEKGELSMSKSLTMLQGAKSCDGYSCGDYISGTTNTLTWSDTGVSWYTSGAEGQMNRGATQYIYFAIG